MEVNTILMHLQWNRSYEICPAKILAPIGHHVPIGEDVGCKDSRFFMLDIQVVLMNMTDQEQGVISSSFQ